MRWTYSCPKCGAHLNPSGGEVVILGELEGKRGLMLLNAEPGNYDMSIPWDMVVDAGQVWDFYCPVCQMNLAEESGEMIHLKCHCDDEGEHLVFFARKAGIHATFVLDSEGETVASHGAHKTDYERLSWMKWWRT